MGKPKLTPQEQRDLEYHEWCRAALPPGWQLFASTFGYGCSAYPKGRTRCDEFPHGALEEFALLRERIEKLEAECEFVKAQKESLQRTAEFAVSLADEFERAVASREPVSGMQVTPTGDFISAAQLPSVLKRMKWWAREIRKADSARAALGEVEREG